MRYTFLPLLLTFATTFPAMAVGQESAAEAKEPKTQVESPKAKKVAEQESTWTPPASPDPFQIFHQARRDAGAGRYADALAKHVWFHEHALEVDESYYGVRLSYALEAWSELAKVYPPAKQKLLETRDQAKADALTQGDPFNAFSDLQSINEVLGQSAITVDVFKVLVKKSRPKARKLFSIAKNDLMAKKEYELCGEFLDPETDFAGFKRNYEETVRLAAEPDFGDNLAEFARKSFTYEVTSTVALLVLNDRKQEASELADKASKVLDTAEFKRSLDEALEGKVPPPWP
ncbi:hypothetical protein NG895_11725 [Aeoliella sp. ICT_H6.2]|uniref:Uncharacterized protein n=1 Tax=Aeoliella straminimaris TaxID=2954799 RepID=A0A9X2JGB9_9BACT|nr:hypothetical protein [Aeoliella straminimaris]MCO6044576.1 hypothetical protein [Aeoliella straminimaris]